MKRTTISITFVVLVTLFTLTGIAAQAAHASGSPSVDVSSRTWQEEGLEVSAVCVNGKEIVCYRGQPGIPSEKADDLALKLQAVLADHKFDPNELLPAKDGSLATIQQSGSNVFSFEGSNPASPKESSLKLVNAIRVAYGAPTVPASYIKVTETASALHSFPNFKMIGNHFSGHASWYGPHFHGKRCSDGSRFDQEQLTAAHRSLPFGTKLLVTNRATGHSCIVKINDRGPYIGDRVIDLSKGAARQLKMLSSGVAMVDCLVISNNSIH